MFRFNTIVFAVCIFALGCAAPRYQPPSANRGDVAAEHRRQAEIRHQAKKEDFRYKVLNDIKRQAYLIDLAYPIRRAGVRLSQDKQTWREFGFYFKAIDSWGKTKKERYQWEVLFEEYGIKDGQEFSVTVWHIVPGSPAEQTGLQKYDRIVAVNGKSFRSSTDFANKLILDAQGKVKFDIVRDADYEFFTLDISTVPISRFDIQYSADERINAFADGKALYIMKGLMDFVDSERELQFVIAHELAHNIERHIDKKKNNSLLGGLLGGAVDVFITAKTGIGTSAFGRTGRNIGVLAHSKAFEREADYLGMYLLANAGISIQGVADFWRKMSTLGAGYSRTHPSTAERFVNLMAIEQEINDKITGGAALLPNK